MRPRRRSCRPHRDGSYRRRGGLRYLTARSGRIVRSDGIRRRRIRTDVQRRRCGGRAVVPGVRVRRDAAGGPRRKVDALPRTDRPSRRPSRKRRTRLPHRRSIRRTSRRRAMHRAPCRRRNRVSSPGSRRAPRRGSCPSSRRGFASRRGPHGEYLPARAGGRPHDRKIGKNSRGTSLPARGPVDHHPCAQATARTQGIDPRARRRRWQRSRRAAFRRGTTPPHPDRSRCP